MQQSISTIIGQIASTGKREQEHRNIRAKSTGTPKVIADNSFLKECFTDIPLTDIADCDLKKPISPKKNMKRLIKAATDYLALYDKELSFTPTGKFGRDMTDLIHAITLLLPEGQSLNVDYIDNDGYEFFVYQSHPNRCWDIITYIPVSITETMRPTIRKLFIRFMAFIMQQNSLPTIKETYEYDIFVEDVKSNMVENKEEVDEQYIDTMRSYKNKRGKANRMLQQIKQCDNYAPNELLTELKSLKRISLEEKEQVDCMIRGLELLSQDSLLAYSYDDTYDNINCEYADDNEATRWHDLICISWGTSGKDALIDYHFEGVSDRCNNFGATEPQSCQILSPEKVEKLAPCTFPFEWLDYICNDFYKHLTTNE